MHSNQRFLKINEGLVKSKAFILFYFDEETDQIEIARDIHKLNTLEILGMAQIVENYATELMANYGSTEDYE